MIWIHNCMIIANEYPPIYQHLKIMNRSILIRSRHREEIFTFKSEPYRLLARWAVARCQMRTNDSIPRSIVKCRLICEAESIIHSAVFLHSLVESLFFGLHMLEVWFSDVRNGKISLIFFQINLNARESKYWKYFLLFLNIQFGLECIQLWSWLFVLSRVHSQPIIIAMAGTAIAIPVRTTLTHHSEYLKTKRNVTLNVYNYNNWLIGSVYRSITQ